MALDLRVILIIPSYIRHVKPEPTKGSGTESEIERESQRIYLLP